MKRKLLYIEENFLDVCTIEYSLVEENTNQATTKKAHSPLMFAAWSC